MAMIHPHPCVRVTTGIRTGIARMDRSPTRTGREIAATPGTRWRPDSVNVPDSSRWEITVIQSPREFVQHQKSHGLVRGMLFVRQGASCVLVNACDTPVFERDLFMFCLWSLDLCRLNYICFFAQSSDLPVEILTLLQVKKTFVFADQVLLLTSRCEVSRGKNLGNKVGPRGKKVLCLAGHCWQCSRMQPVDSPCEVRPSKRTCIEKERQPIYYYTVVYVGVYIYIYCVYVHSRVYTVQIVYIHIIHVSIAYPLLAVYISYHLLVICIYIYIHNYIYIYT